MAEPAAPDHDPSDLHGLAVDTLSDLQKLSTGLAHAGAAPQAVQTLTKMAAVLEQVVKVLGQAPGAAPQPGQPAAQPSPQPQAPPPEQAQPAPPSGQQAVQQHSILSATHALHAAAQASAQRRQPQPQQP